MECEALSDNNEMTENIINYNDIFSTDVKKQIQVAQIIIKNLHKRNKLMIEMKNTAMAVQRIQVQNQLVIQEVRQKK